MIVKDTPKWDIIVEHCKKQKYTNSAIIANRILTSLKSIYDWYDKMIVPARKMPKKWSDTRIYSLAGDPEYCVACQEENEDCNACEFGRVNGKCSYPDGIYGEFVNAFVKEASIIFVADKWDEHYDE